MDDWISELFIDHSGIFLKLLDRRWSRTEELVNGIVRILDDFGIRSGRLLDLCCGNGRISIYMAKKGFEAVGVDISRTFVEDARRKAEEHGVSDSLTFLEGDVRKLIEVVGANTQPFDVVVNAWTSIGYYSEKDDLSILKQARELSREGAVLFITETMHSEYLSLKFVPTSFMEIEDTIMLENREYDPKKSQITVSWSFYKKLGEDLKFMDRVDYRLHVYSLGGLCGLLRRAGWKPTATYGNLATLQPSSPLSSLNIVALLDHPSK